MSRQHGSAPRRSRNRQPRSGQWRNRRFVAEQLFNGLRKERRIVDHPLALSRVSSEPGDKAGQRRRHRVESGEDQHEDDVHHFLATQSLPVDLGVHEPADQIVTRRRLRLALVAGPGRDTRPCDHSPGPDGRRRRGGSRRS